MYSLRAETKSKSEEYLSYVVDDFKFQFDHNKDSCHWSHYTDFEDIRHLSLLLVGWLPHCLDMLRNIQRCEVALDSLIDCADYVHQYLKTLSDYSEDMMYSWYKAIEEFAREAQIHTEDDELFQKYWDIEEKYLSKIKELTGKDFDSYLFEDDDEE